MIQVRFLVGPLYPIFHPMSFPYQNIFSLSSEEEFNQLSLQIFHYQYTHNPVYHQFVNHLFEQRRIHLSSIQHYTQIPFLPIEFFKTHTVSCFPVHTNTLFFESSGTTHQRLSRHYIYDESIYQQSILKTFELFYGNPSSYLFLFLLPDEKQRPHSSLIYMARYLQSLSTFQESGFYLNNWKALKEVLLKYSHSSTKLFILGLSYALLDLCTQNISLNPSAIVVETGGMKGKRKEIPKPSFHTYLKNELGVSNIQSEYGMTELLSQAYALKNQIFSTPPWMKVLLREMDDPLSVSTTLQQGLINILDLANVYSCAFIATADIGRLYDTHHFEILGRSDFSNPRGCNLMYE